MASKATRATVRVLVALLLIALVVAGGYFGARALLGGDSRASAPSQGAFAKEPSPAQAIEPASFGVTSFVPILGTGNTTGPVAYGAQSLVAGVSDTGATVLIGLGSAGRAQWETSLGGPLVTCADHADDAHQLPCLVKSSTGSLITLVDVTSGVSKWLWEDDQDYMNILLDDDGTIVLLGRDLSLTRISHDGVLTAEPMLTQAATDQELVPDASSCPIGASSPLSPEAFKQLSPQMYLISHGGLNTLVSSQNNQVIAAVPGTMLRAGSSDNDRWVIAPQDGCATAALVLPGRNRVQMLPEDVSLPIPADHTIPEVVIRDSHLYTMNWDGPAVGNPAYNHLDVTFDGTPKVAMTDTTGVAVGEGTLSAFSKESGKELWHVGVQVHDFVIADDVVLVNTDDGRVAGFGLYSGETQFELPVTAKGRVSMPDPETLQIDSQTGLFRWRAGAGTDVVSGTRATVGTVTPGISYSAGGCVRVHKLEGDKDRYTAYTTRIDCTLAGAEPILGILTTDQKPRNADIADYLKTCTDRYPETVSTMTVTSSRAEASISALCLGDPAKAAR